MYCKNCGSEVADDAIFCSYCGTRLEPQEAPKAEPAEKQMKDNTEVAAPVQKKEEPAQEAPRKPFLEEMQWDVSEYPDSSTIEKTEDINFDWNADPDSIPDRPVRPVVVPQPQPQQEKPAPPKTQETIRVSEIFDRVVPVKEVAKASKKTPEAVIETELGSIPIELDKFNTFNRKNQEFQDLLDREYEKIKDAGTIGSEQSQADELADRRFDSRQDEMTMDEFLEREGAVKLYEPKPLQSDVLARIDAQEKKRARQLAEEEARAKALEEARAEAEAKKKAEIEKRNSEVEASAAAAEEIRLAEEEEIRRRTEEEAKRKAEAEAAHLEAIAARQAAREENELKERQAREAEEARVKAEEEARAKAEAEARAKAEEEARARAEEEARLKAEAELKAQQEAARIRAQQEANRAAREEAQFRAEQEKRRQEEQMALLKRETLAKKKAREENAAAVEEEVRDALAQTAKMREEEEEKIRAALAGIRGGRFSDTISSTIPAGEKPKNKEKEEPKQPEITDPVKTAEEERIEEAHRKTQDQINEMAKARQTFFADFPDAEELKAAAEEGKTSVPDLTHTRMIHKENMMEEISNTRKISKEELHLDEDQEFFRQFEEADKVAAQPQSTAVEEPTIVAKPAVEEPTIVAKPRTEEEKKLAEIDDLLGQFASVAGAQDAAAEPTRVFDGPFAEPVVEVPAEEPFIETPEEPVIDTPAEEPFAEVPDEPVFEVPAVETPIEEPVIEVPAEEPASIPFERPAEEVPAEPTIDFGAPAAPAEAPAEPTIDFGAPEAPAEVPVEEEEEEEPVIEKPGLEDTMVMPYKTVEKAKAASEAAAAVAAATEGMTAKERKKYEKEQAKEAKRLAKEKKKEAKEALTEDTFGEDFFEEEEEPTKGGTGRIVLMIILIILCIIFALELAGIGIKLLAPTSGAAEFIDNILNSLIHAITG